MATLTINTTPQQDARIIEAFGHHLELGRNATGPEVKQAVIDHIKSVVYSYETAQAASSAAAAVDQIEPA